MPRTFRGLLLSLTWALTRLALALLGGLLRALWAPLRAAPLLAARGLPPLYPEARLWWRRFPGGAWVCLGQIHVNSWSLLPLLPTITIPMRWDSPVLTSHLMAWWNLSALVWFRSLAAPCAWLREAEAEASASARFRAYAAPRARSRRRFGRARDS